METTAGKVVASPKQYKVSCVHDHKSLEMGDVVVMVETPRLEMFLLRVSDMTLHSLEDSNDQYVHLVEMGATNGDSETA